MAQANYRLIDIDAHDSENGFSWELLAPRFPPVVLGDIQTLATHCRQLLQRGDQKGALRSALENVPYGGDDLCKLDSDNRKELHLSTILDILSSIKQTEMSPLLIEIYCCSTGTELLDILTRYLYKGMARYNASGLTSPAISTHGTSASSASSNAGAPREFGVAVSRGDGGGMSVLLSWHEKVVEVAGPGAIVRVMTDRRTV